MDNPYRLAKFLQSGSKLSQLPSNARIEVAFIGRSNAGKSSVLNTLTQQKNLAKTSKTPGRTRLINLFEIKEHEHLVDLPGYGYAEVPASVKREWEATLHEYLEKREALRGLIVVMDCRHPLKPFDISMITWAQEAELNVHLLLNKIDKLSKSEAAKVLSEVRKIYPETPELSSQTFSTQTGFGLKELIGVLNHWFK